MMGMREIDERMFCIINEGSPEELCAVLALGANPNADDGCALFGVYDDPNMLRILIDAGADLHARCPGWNPMGYWKDDLTVVEHLIGASDEYDTRKVYAQCLAMLLDAGADPAVRMTEEEEFSSECDCVIPEIFLDVIKSHVAAIALAITTPEAAAPAKATRL